MAATQNRRPRIVVKRHRQRTQFFTEALGDGVGLEMLLIPAGSFVMGSLESELERTEAEGPQHAVTVPTFFLGKYAITQAQWRAVAALPPVDRELEADPSYFKGENRPVENVSWWNAVEFCARVAHKTGREYRLPSEAEWEYACRAGTTTPFHFGETITPELANYDGNYTYGDGPAGAYPEETMPVGSFGVANEFGLFDMHGNVWEWCADPCHDSYEGAPGDGSAWINNENDNHSQRLLRGGSWFASPEDCRSAFRVWVNVDVRVFNTGFRVACSAA